MKGFKHLTIEQRKVISNGIANGYKLVQIASALDLDPTSISKEVKRNRIISFNNKNTTCEKTNRWPYVCTNCSKKYDNRCTCIKYKYDANYAQKNADYKLVQSRRGIDVDEDSFKLMDKIIKEGNDNNKSIYQIVIENKTSIDKSVSTIYRYINNNYLTTKRIDLPCAVTYKKRKYNKKYDYSSNNLIDRTNHTFVDYLAYIHENPGIYTWQMDFLGSTKQDSNNILSLILPNLHFTLLYLIKNPTSEKVVAFFDELEVKIGTAAFKKLIPVILTDRDPCFTDIDGICTSKITGEERCKLFFCNPYCSNQKASVENINKQLRLFFPKGKSIDKYNKKDILNINLALLNKPLKSLDGFTPRDAFTKVFDLSLFNKLL